MRAELRLLPSLVRSERALRGVAPAEASFLQELIELVRELPPPPPAVFEPPCPPLRTFVRPPPKPAFDPQEAPTVPRGRPRPVRKKHLTLVPPPAPPPPEEPKRHVPPDPIGDKMREAEGARALLLEIIRRAAFDWVLYRSSTRIDQKQLAEDARTWIFEEDEEHPHWKLRKADEKLITGFVSICDALDLDVERVRSYVRKLTPNRVMSSGRPPENSRASEHHQAVEIHTRVNTNESGTGESIDFDALITQLMDYDG